MIGIQWYIFAFLGALFTGLALVVEKKTLKTEPPLQTVTSISLINFLFMVVLVTRVNFNLEFPTYVLIYIVSLLISISLWYVARGLRHLEISSAMPLLSFGPAIVAILSWLFLGESLNGIKISGILLIMLGSYVLETDHRLSDLSNPFRKIIRSRYIHFILVALLLMSIAVILNSFILRDSSLNIDFITYFFLIMLFSTLNFFILISIYDRGIESIKKVFKLSWKWIALTSFFNVVGNLFFFKAISIQLISLVYPVHKLNILFSTLIGGELFHEHKLVLKFVATIIMLIGAYLLIL